MTVEDSDAGLPVQARDGITGERVATRLREDILHGVHVPGERLRQQDLSAEYGASRVPVRDALRILESEGIVKTVANTGAWIAELTKEECIQLYEVRERVEPLLLAASMPALESATIDRLEAISEQMRTTSDIDEFVDLDREFHLLSYSSNEADFLGTLVGRLWNMTHYYRRSYSHLLTVKNLTLLHAEHQLLVAAIREGDSHEAERVLAGHIRRTRLHLAQHPEVFTGSST